MLNNYPFFFFLRNKHTHTRERESPWENLIASYFHTIDSNQISFFLHFIFLSTSISFDVWIFDSNQTGKFKFQKRKKKKKKVWCWVLSVNADDAGSRRITHTPRLTLFCLVVIWNIALLRGQNWFCTHWVLLWWISIRKYHNNSHMVWRV